jgi:uncharacterized damage-inducible protein DinB
MNERERQRVLEQLESSRTRIIGMLESLTPEQWAFQPESGRWSANEVLEHVVVVENRVLGFISEKTKGEPDPVKQSQAQDEMLAAALPDRTNKRQAPAVAHPSGQWPGAQALSEFENTRQRTIDFVSKCPQNLRHYFQPHGAFGELDCYQWVVLLALHADRHGMQIEEVKAAPGFPA